MDQKLLRRVRRRDRMANWLITAGGLFVIICVLGILVLIANVAVPLLLPPAAQQVASFPLPRVSGEGRELLAVGVDDYLEVGYVITGQGEVGFFDLKQGRLLDTRDLYPPPESVGETDRPEGPEAARTAEPGEPGEPEQGSRPGLVHADPLGGGKYSLLWSDGTLNLVRIYSRRVFDPQGRPSMERMVDQQASLTHSGVEERANPALLSLGRVFGGEDEETQTRVSLLQDGKILVEKHIRGMDLLGEETLENFREILETGLEAPITALQLDSEGNNLYAGTEDGHLLRWTLQDPEDIRLLDRLQGFPDGRVITSLGMLLGDTTLLVGDEKGGVSGWFPVPRGDEGMRVLALVHRIKPHPRPVKGFQPAHQSKFTASISSSGTVHLDQLTNEQHLLTLTDGETRPGGSAPAGAGVILGAISPRDDGYIALTGDGQVILWHLRIPHPEVSLGGYFGKIWYENYPRSAYVWQSSSGTDDFEPKFSLMPLVFGTLKGTFWGMLFAAPLAILAAMYTSHLMQPGLRRYIKPAFEIMGSVPTVVIGFLAALWLAPLVKASLTGFLLIMGILPLTVLVALVVYGGLARYPFFSRLVRGHEFLFMAPALLLGVWLAFVLGARLDTALFGGELPAWLFENLGVRFDQRNSIVISAALGFAVLPIIFTISDDALVNVPRNLTAASLALGASRWQTVWRVILPSASPGIFAALMVGLGRATGETMIVLMATGNTPLMDWSIFNGMRTMSANIAVEIPEAPVDGTLYRTLFLSAVLLFITTFILNTLAEVVRMRLRKKFGQY
ncbi:MAG: ABC transporter permease subunit [Deltaproteobacteria bacterium]|nr:ABC transporter permease subunit [Deltaproteobacteria bacterium]